MKFLHSLMLAGASLPALATGAYAAETPAPVQDEQAAAPEAEGEIIVTARRRDESLQDVPLTVNAVTSEDIAKLNIRRFEEITTVVPGLQLANNANGIGAIASVRGIAYDVNASGNNGSIEFYQNDAPISAGNLFQAMYDIGQVELLRGPQGTLRGRASPSGSMTVTTRRPDLAEIGGFLNFTATTIGGINAQGAFNLPIIGDMLSVRVAGVVDESEGSRVRSLNNGVDPFSKTRSGRASVRFEPTDTLSFDVTYQKVIQNIRAFDQVESQQLVIGTLPASPILITGKDRRALGDSPRRIRQEFNNLNWRAQFAFAGQRLNYVGGRNTQHFLSKEASDTGDFFGPAFPAFTKDFGQYTDSRAKSWSHELRLSSEEAVGGFLDYIIGGLLYKQRSPTNLTQNTLVLFGLPAPNVGGTVVGTPISRTGGYNEKSAFANLTAHIGTATEISGGVRYISYKDDGALSVGGVNIPAAESNRNYNTWIYMASAKHNFSDDFMVYATTGSSWRAGAQAVGDFSLVRSPLENSFILTDPERSKSYEIGFKASALDKRLKINISAFHQDFKDYPYRSPSGVFFVETVAVDAMGNPTAQRVRPFNFIAGVPVKVNGVEAEVSFQATPDWDIGLNATYAKGLIKNGLIPCNDYFINATGVAGSDGIPDTGTQVPNIAQIQSASGNQNLNACNVTQRASLNPLWSANIQSEYRLPISDSVQGFARGLASFYGKSQNDPTNAVDDYGSYALVNLYAGIRSPKGDWEVSLYGKNITNTYVALTRSSTPLNTGYNIGAAAQQGPTRYYGISSTNPREFGINVRYAFGSR